MNGKLSFCTPVFNKWNFTESYLKDLSCLNHETHEIIIVDNASTDNTQSEINKWLEKLPNLVYIRNEINSGFGQASNQAFQVAKHDCIMFLNNDIKVYKNQSNWTDVYLTALTENPDQIVSPTGGLVDINREFQFCYETDGDKKFNYLSGWMLASTKQTFNKLIENNNIGPFRSDLYFAYFEDTHLSFNATEMGIPLSLIANNSVNHFGKITSKQINTAKLYGESRKIFIGEWKKK